MCSQLGADVNLNECVIWWGTIREDGRPMVGKDRYAYRVIYQLLYGRLPRRIVLHHTCGNPSCVNPYHLEPMTQGQHIALHAMRIIRAIDGDC